ncbi:Phosphoserine phosphatase [Coemansia sp. RSA 2523]|nr:Phosphoserine phosphatase [Coemansia sp. RSA 1824]KAJ1811149.1 Phosphoserine phosphatase [Coemansia sp. RSA 2523]KAJ2430142.1 Phosphoserine phosphatase [Coemansia sp. RSA 2524]KAJ2552524.1 Phosphoserine phosphatase [Coemansia sp. RSA 1878]
MKYGSYLELQKAEFPASWQAHFLDYTMLKTYLKTRMVDTSVHLSTACPSLTFKWEDSIADTLGSRLERVRTLTPEFIRMLDAQVTKVNTFFERMQSDIQVLCKALRAEQEPQSVLNEVLRLERFVFLNFTGVAKALKKHDKWAGLFVREPYLVRMSELEFVASTELQQIKAELVARLGCDEVVGSSRDTTRAPTPSDKHRADIEHATQTAMVSLRGPHGTDIIGGVLTCLSKHKCQIVDFSLSRLHHDVTFGVLVHLHERSVDLFSDLAQTAQRWDGTLSFDVQDAQLKATKLATSAQYALSEAPYAQRIKYVATVLNERGLSPEFLSEWLAWLLAKKISVEQMRRLDRRTSLMCVEFRLSVPHDLGLDKVRAELIAISSAHQTDVALQPDNVFRRQKRLVVFDMDSTLIQQEVIDEIARATGIEEQVAAITERAMQGEMDFGESLAARVALLAGTPVSVLEGVKQRLVFTEGAHYLCRALKSAGFKLAVISGGFLPLAKHVKTELGLDYAFANQLAVSADGSVLVGETVGPVVDAARKAELLEVIAQAEGIAIDQVVAVGDGANDLLMLAKASLGIAFNAKPRVQEQARARINQKSLANILYLMGYSESEASELQLLG